jgi:hypothetical protein
MDQGFCVQYRKDNTPGDQCTEIFTSDDLRRLADGLKLQRGLDRSAPRRRLHGTLVERLAGTYQDFLRALGWELDQIPATDVLIDDLRERVVVTFGRRGHGPGQLEEKRVAVVEKEERRAILKDARDRRAPSPTLFLRTLASSAERPS